MLRRLKELLKSPINRLLMRRIVWETRKDVKTLLKRQLRTRDDISLWNDTLLIIEKKVEHLSAKVDAHADVDDQFKNTLLDAAQQLRATVDQAGQSLLALEDRLNIRLAAAVEQSQTANAALEERVSALQGTVEALQSHTEMADAEVDFSKLQKNQTLIAERLDNAPAQPSRMFEELFCKVKSMGFNETRQIETRDALEKLMALELPLPATRGWAASPDFLLCLYEKILIHRPELILEFGSGVSTVVAGAALMKNGKGRIHSLEHDQSYVKKSQDLLSYHSLGDIATVYHAPLGPWSPSLPTGLSNERWQWYSVPEAVLALSGIDCMVIDGPPKSAGKYARYPAVPQFYRQLAEQCLILLDDARRPHERASAKAWSREFDMDLRLFLNEELEYEKGLAILTKQAAGNAVKRSG